MSIWQRVYEWFLGLIGKGRKPKRVRNVTVEIDMKNAHVTWTDPTERGSGNALILGGIEVSLSADLGASFSSGVLVDPGVEAFDFFDLADAEYIVRLQAVDTVGRRSVDVDTPFLIDNSDPNPVTNVAITFD